MPKSKLFGEIKSGIGIEDLKSLYQNEAFKINTENEKGSKIVVSVLKLENCSHLNVSGSCSFNFFNNRLSYVFFKPSNVLTYESAAIKLLGIKFIENGRKYYLNDNVFLESTSDNNYFWRDVRYWSEGIALLD